MKTTPVAKSSVVVRGSTIVVSTIRLQMGREVWFETSLIINGQTTDGLRASKRDQALVDHDKAADVVRGYVSADDRKVEFWVRAAAECLAA